eukprot:gene3319-4159_t
MNQQILTSGTTSSSVIGSQHHHGGHQRRISQQNNSYSAPNNIIPPFSLLETTPTTSNINTTNSGTPSPLLSNSTQQQQQQQQQQTSTPLKKGANTEVYGFVYWIATFVGYVIYLLWAFIPEHILSDLGVHYYPSKYWAVAIPMYFVVCGIFGLTVYFCINLIITEPLESFNTFKDRFSQEADPSHIYLPESIPPLTDIPISVDTSGGINNINTPISIPLVSSLLTTSPTSTTNISPLNMSGTTTTTTNTASSSTSKIRNPLSVSTVSTNSLLSSPTTTTSSTSPSTPSSSVIRSHHLPLLNSFTSSYQQQQQQLQQLQQSQTTSNNTNNQNSELPSTAGLDASSTMIEDNNKDHTSTIRRVNTLPVLMFINKGYLKTETPVGSIRTSLLAPKKFKYPLHYCSNHTHTDSDSHDKNTVSQLLPCEYWDESLVVFPIAEQSAFTATTRVRQLTQVVNYQPFDPECRYRTDDEVNSYIADVESFTLLIDHTMYAPSSKIQRNAIQLKGFIQDHNGKDVVLNDGISTIGVAGQPDIIQLGTLLDYANVNLDDPLKLIENTEYTVLQPIVMENILHRYVYKRHGVRVLFIQTGSIGQFNFQSLLLTLVSGMGLLAVSTIIVDQLAIRILPQRKSYSSYKFQVTEGMQPMKKIVTNDKGDELIADKGGNPDLIRESQKARFKSVEAVQEIIDLDKTVKETKYRLDQSNAEYTKINKQVAMKKKAGEACDDLIQQAETLDKEIGKLKVETAEREEQLSKALKPIGNIVHKSVPISNNEDDNLVVKTWGDCKNSPDLLHHHELLEMIDGYDLERGTNTSGHRCYFLKGIGVLLNQAIINFALATLTKKGFTALQTPFFMRKEIMAETAQLEQFDEELYKVIGGAQGEDNEKYLIATSEQPISAYHRKEWIDERELPKKYAGYSTCFRKEAGAHGRDTWGIFRVHQFEKIEQFCITEPEKSWDMHEEMLANAETFYQELGIPYRVVSIVSGALNNAAAKKYDLEGWFPGYNQYRELVSCSNCTDYQSRDLEIRCGQKKQGQQQKKYVHMLNSTLAATTRVICCILENYQTEGGITVPKPLQPFLAGMEFIPFVKPRPKNKKN